MTVSRDRLVEIFTNENEEIPCDLLGGSCNALRGLNLIAKYLPNSGIVGATHDKIYATNIDDILKAGLTEEDAITLVRMNWCLEDEEYLVCFV